MYEARGIGGDNLIDRWDWQEELRQRHIAPIRGTQTSTAPTNAPAPICGRNIDSTVVAGTQNGVPIGPNTVTALNLAQNPNYNAAPTFQTAPHNQANNGAFDYIGAGSGAYDVYTNFVIAAPAGNLGIDPPWLDVLRFYKVPTGASFDPHVNPAAAIMDVNARSDGNYQLVRIPGNVAGQAYDIYMAYIDHSGLPSAAVLIGTTAANPIVIQPGNGAPVPSGFSWSAAASSITYSAGGGATYDTTFNLNLTINNYGTGSPALSTWLYQVAVLASIKGQNNFSQINVVPPPGGTVINGIVAPGLGAGNAYDIKIRLISFNSNSYTDSAVVFTTQAQYVGPGGISPSGPNLVVDSNFMHVTQGNASNFTGSNDPYWNFYWIDGASFYIGAGGYQTSTGMANYLGVRPADSSRNCLAQSEAIPVTAGQQYGVSGYIDATHCSGNQPSVQIVSTDGLTVYKNVPQTNGTNGIVSDTWTCPSDGSVTQVTFRFASNTTTISGGNLVFAIPQLQMGAPGPYQPGPSVPQASATNPPSGDGGSGGGTSSGGGVGDPNPNPGVIKHPIHSPQTRSVIGTTPGGEGSYVNPGQISGRHFHGGNASDSGDMVDSSSNLLHTRHSGAVTATIASTAGGDGSYLQAGKIYGRHISGMAAGDTSVLADNTGKFLHTRHSAGVQNLINSDASHNATDLQGFKEMPPSDANAGLWGNTSGTWVFEKTGTQMNLAIAPFVMECTFKLAGSANGGDWGFLIASNTGTYNTAPTSMYWIYLRTGGTTNYVGLRAYKRTGGTDTQIGSEVALTANSQFNEHHLKATFYNDSSGTHIWAQFDNSTPFTYLDPTASTPYTTGYVGIYNVGNLRIRDISWKHSYSEGTNLIGGYQNNNLTPDTNGSYLANVKLSGRHFFGGNTSDTGAMVDSSSNLLFTRHASPITATLQSTLNGASYLKSGVIDDTHIHSVKLDTINDGTTYARIKGSELSTGIVTRIGDGGGTNFRTYAHISGAIDTSSRVIGSVYDGTTALSPANFTNAITNTGLVKVANATGALPRANHDSSFINAIDASSRLVGSVYDGTTALTPANFTSVITTSGTVDVSKPKAGVTLPRSAHDSSFVNAIDTSSRLIGSIWDGATAISPGNVTNAITNTGLVKVGNATGILPRMNTHSDFTSTVNAGGGVNFGVSGHTGNIPHANTSTLTRKAIDDTGAFTAQPKNLLYNGGFAVKPVNGYANGVSAATLNNNPPNPATDPIPGWAMACYGDRAGDTYYVATGSNGGGTSQYDNEKADAFAFYMQTNVTTNGSWTGLAQRIAVTPGQWLAFRGWFFVSNLSSCHLKFDFRKGDGTATIQSGTNSSAGSGVGLNNNTGGGGWSTNIYFYNGPSWLSQPTGGSSGWQLAYVVLQVPSDAYWCDFLQMTGWVASGNAQAGQFYMDNLMLTVSQVPMMFAESVNDFGLSHPGWHKTFNNAGNVYKSTAWNQQGSMPPCATPGVSITASNSSGNCSVTISWSAGTIYTPDNGYISIASGSWSQSGLSASTAYHYSVYADSSGGVHILGNYGAGAAPNAQQKYQVYLDGRYPITEDTYITTPATSGGGPTGGGGGGGGSCPSLDQVVRVKELGHVAAREYRVGMHLMGPDGEWKRILKVVHETAQLFRVTVAGETYEVDTNHYWLGADGEFVKTPNLSMNTMLRSTDGRVLPIDGIVKGEIGAYAKTQVEGGQFVIGRLIGHNAITL